MAEHLLNHLDVGSSRDCQAGRSVPEIVGGKAVEAGRPCSWSEHPVPEVGVTEYPATGSREHKVISILALDVRRKRLDQQPR